MQLFNSNFTEVEGGLFSSVEKADVGNSYQQLGKQGVDLLGWADPFYPDRCIPNNVLSASINALSGSTPTHYTPPVGNENLKKEIAKKAEIINHLKLDPERNILITPGSDSGLFFAMMPFLEKGDEVILPVPCYPNNIQNTKLLGAKPVYLKLKEKEKYQINAEALEDLVTSKTKMIILTHPNNPTTTVFNKDSLEAIRKVVLKYNLVLVCDQAFEDFTFENEFITPASLSGMFNNTVTVCSISKGMGLSGYRVAYIMTNDHFMDKYYGAAVSVIGATNTVSQIAAVEAFKNPSFMKTFETAYDYRRNKAFELLNSIPGVSMIKPESGFLGWINVSKLGTAAEVQSYLIKEAKVFLNAGNNYGPGGEGHLRIVLGTYKDNVRMYEILKRIKEALLKYPS